MLGRRALRTPERPVQRRQGPSLHPPSQVHGPVCRAPNECLPLHGRDERSLRPPPLSARRAAACDSAYVVILLRHCPMKTLETLHRFGKCLITLLGAAICLLSGRVFLRLCALAGINESGTNPSHGRPQSPKQWDVQAVSREGLSKPVLPPPSKLGRIHVCGPCCPENRATGPPPLSYPIRRGRYASPTRRSSRRSRPPKRARPPWSPSCPLRWPRTHPCRAGL